jgi:hypothetical protein
VLLKDDWQIKIKIRQHAESDLSAADYICRLAFGTFLGLPDPMTFSGDADNVKTRFLVRKMLDLSDVMWDDVKASQPEGVTHNDKQTSLSDFE